ncbi:MAG TPA: site-2 protease family protein [Stellaceae bacterium]|nr:site-2 protease family protein [Stellaceae bacterium]
MAVAAATASNGFLPPLREEIGLYPGPRALDGSPTWTLHDPARNQFFRIGWPEFEMLSRWDAGNPAALLQRIRNETTLDLAGEDVGDVARFLVGHNLTRCSGREGTVGLLARAARLRQNWAMWLLKNYLFLRIPLVRPDRWLTAAYPWIRFVFTPAFRHVVLAVAALALYLAARRWDEYLDTFSYLFSVEGAVYFALTLSALKVVHEFGHAFTAKRYGCRVPSMGVAFLVLWPVLYTDVTESWKLPSRAQRLAVGVSGVTAELVCAVFATLAWSFLPDGPLRSAAFLVSTTTWVSTVLINLSPFMRFDGYFVFSDWLEMPNLHQRAFALARWWLRERLLGLRDPPPEDLPPGRRAFVIAFAFCTWAYRLSLFLGIALLVYHFAVKIIGVGLMAVEIGYFIVRPVWSEAAAVWKLRHRLRRGRGPVLSAAFLLLLLLGLIVPWRSAVEAPALVRSSREEKVFAPEQGTRVAAIKVADGAIVAKGTPLIELESPDLGFKLEQARTDVAVLQWQLQTQGVSPDLMARSRVAEPEYEAASAQYRALADAAERLHIIAPMTGRVVDIADDLRPGLWLPPKTRLLSVIDTGESEIEAYVYESDVSRIALGNVATFHPDGSFLSSFDARVTAIDRANTRFLPDAYLASRFGGTIPVRETPQGELVPERAIYRIVLAPEHGAGAPAQILRGRVVIRGRAESLVARAWRAVLAVLVRESGA